ncbi:BrnT family toxin [Bdellovibrio bacteriovorus]|uniref:BrnT family toxin n=1 Tax=Bdellovibrio bacteriovorus TaxID=959 RepID=UPI003977981D
MRTGNRRGKQAKHGLSAKDIERFFKGQPAYTNDDKHSEIEPRFIAFGQLDSRFIFVAFTVRATNGKLLIRPISARYARENEIRKLYEKTFK